MARLITVKILSYKSPQRYAVKQTLKAAQYELRKHLPGLEIVIEEVKELAEIEEYTPVIILPSLVVNDKLVCIGRFPKKDEVVEWLQHVADEGAS